MKLIQDYQNKKVLIVGLAKSGFYAAQLLQQLGAQVTVNDKQTLPNDDKSLVQLQQLGIQVIMGGHPLQLLDEDFSLIVKNPGIPYDNPLIKAAMARKIPIITEPELAYEVSSAPMVCVTGTNGKTTTTTLIQLILDQNRSAGHAYKAGNIGIPVSQVVQKASAEDDIVVEMSSFQLLGVTQLRPKVAVLTNIYEAHLDYHKTRANYIKAKMNITKNQTAADYFVVNYDQKEWRDLAQQSAAQIVPFSRLNKSQAGAYQKGNDLYFRDEKIISISELPLPGKHNIENYLAAIAVAKIYGKTKADICQVLTTFQGVKHRIQFVKKLAGRSIYNDSKATNIEATIVALEAFSQPIVLIAGGLDRGFTFDKLVEPLKKVKAIILYGQTKHLMAAAAQKAQIPTIKLVDNLDEAVPLAWSLTDPGDVLLLSPAAASWDQFQTFEQRGDRFLNDIKKLGE
ncbi:UDP-N-acetylmuramoyl-L-alanine--D-glutamate ligase [Bombilactobacillus mellis]|uniref:UDP-N-acetylmuramoyl-L-alanine--D-glutamate ligase n=1 Tax=Bombilactobacillus mellis TaxID=1218508 RepID=UPI0015803F04|nr:UDP-N-acetylmuramoyl-L-alanine--D-glutamate ligase [Bombilactobacillus mellis]NUF25066.1 UDP-N-acetylmuramoyl-L-alanine--D-glutamate ligase [Bombilactobacillus mellis]